MDRLFEEGAGTYLVTTRMQPLCREGERHRRERQECSSQEQVCLRHLVDAITRECGRYAQRSVSVWGCRTGLSPRETISLLSSPSVPGRRTNANVRRCMVFWGLGFGRIPRTVGEAA